MTFDDWLPLLTLLTSLLPGIVIFVLPENRVRLRTTLNLGGAGLKLAFIGVMIWGVHHEHVYETRLPILPDIDLVLNADAMSVMITALSGVLWFLTTLYAIAYLETSSQSRSRFFGFFSLCVSSTIGIALAGNLITVLMFYEMLMLSTYPLEAGLHPRFEVDPEGARLEALAEAALADEILLGGERPIKALITIASPHVGTTLANRALDATDESGFFGGLKSFFGGSGYDTLRRSRGLLFDLAHPYPGSLLYWLNAQKHPDIRYVSVVRLNPVGFAGDELVPGYSQDMNNIPVLRGRSTRISIPSYHVLDMLDGGMIVNLLSELG